MHAEDLKGRAVVTIANANKIGQVDDVLFDADYRNVLGFRVKRGLIHRAEAPPCARSARMPSPSRTSPP